MTKQELQDKYVKYFTDKLNNLTLLQLASLHIEENLIKVKPNEFNKKWTSFLSDKYTSCPCLRYLCRYVYTKYMYARPELSREDSLYDLIIDYIKEIYHFPHVPEKFATVKKYKDKIIGVVVDKDDNEIDMTIENLIELVLEFTLQTGIIKIYQNAIYGYDKGNFIPIPVEKDSVVVLIHKAKNNEPLYFLDTKDNIILNLENRYKVQKDKTIDLFREMQKEQYTQLDIKLCTSYRLEDIKPEHKPRLLNDINFKLFTQ